MSTLTVSPAHSRSRIAEAGVAAATIGGLAWLALAGDSIVRGGSHLYRDALFLVPWVCTAATFVAVHGVQRHRAGRAERGAAVVLLAAMAFVAAGNVQVVLTDAESNFAFPVGAVVFTLTVGLFGVTVARAGVLSRRAGIAIVASQVGTIILAGALSPLVPLHDYGSYTGAVVHGVVMLIVADALRRYARDDAPADRTA